MYKNANDYILHVQKWKKDPDPRLSQVSVTPYRIGFAVPPESTLEEVLDWIVDIFFYVDIFLNFMTAYYQDDVLIEDRRKIARHYFKFWFWIDFLSAFPFDKLIPIFAPNISKSDLRLVKMLRILRLGRMAKLIKYV